MNTVTFNTAAQGRSTWATALGLVSLATAVWALSAGQAQARGGHDDVYWSIGVSSPGAAVGVSNAPPPRPVVVQPQPVVIHQPAPVVIHQPYPLPYPYVQPVVVHPRPVIYNGWGYGPRWDDRHDRRHWKRRHHDRYDRYGRGDDPWDDDDRRGGGDRRR